MEWQPIDTAPKDETFVLVFIPERPFGGAGNASVTMAFAAPDPSDLIGEEAVEWWDWNGLLLDRCAPPTHWMPLPKPPKQETP